MQSRLLKSFLAVADKSSITEAAAALNVSQPALTKSIKQLEADLGVTLFERTSTGVSLTRFGSVLQHHAKIMENEYRHALSRIDDLKGGRKGTIRIGAGPIWLVAILPPIIARFQRENPDVDISLLGGVIALAMVINVITAGLAGVLVPVAFERLDQDPAVASSVFVTMITDSMGFFAFLGLAVACGVTG